MLVEEKEAREGTAAEVRAGGGGGVLKYKVVVLGEWKGPLFFRHFVAFFGERTTITLGQKI